MSNVRINIYIHNVFMYTPYDGIMVKANFAHENG